MTPPPYTLRPATEADAQYIYDLRREVYRAHVVATWGQWDEAWQERYFATKFEPADASIILVAGQPIGEVSWRPEEHRLVLASIEIAPPWQGQGLGTAIIADLAALARRSNVPLELQVLRVNDRARRLYERLGFAVIQGTETHYMMRRE